MTLHVPYTQAGRMMSIVTRLGPDVLLLDGLDIDEMVNGLFTFQATVKSQRDDLAAADLIGSTADFSLRLKDGGTRWWNGLVTELHEGPLTSRGTRSYALTLRPKLWLLSQTSDCRIFRNTSSIDVIETLCSENGITDLQIRIIGAPVVLDYSVQWNETDLDYMLRRMQQDGYFYYHVHEQDRHTLFVTDNQSMYLPPAEPSVRFALGSPAEDHITAWRRSFAFTPGRRSARDWNLLSMQAPADTETTLDPVPGNAAAELYEFPGLFLDTSGAEQAMRARIQTSETAYETAEGTSTVRDLAPGAAFQPKDVAVLSNTFEPQVVLSIRHSLRDPTYETTTERPSYANTFTAMPSRTPATPRRSVPRPVIVGQQIARVAGPTIYCPHGEGRAWCGGTRSGRARWRWSLRRRPMQGWCSSGASARPGPTAWTARARGGATARCAASNSSRPGTAGSTGWSSIGRSRCSTGSTGRAATCCARARRATA